jgi:phage-related minor tail protein
LGSDQDWGDLIVETKDEISKSIESCLSYLKSVEREVSNLVREFEAMGDTMKSAIDSLGNAVSELADAVEAMAEDHSGESRP